MQIKNVAFQCFCRFLPLILLLHVAQAGAAPVNTPFGSCVGSSSNCSSLVGHDSLSIASTLTINEQRAISFGSMAVSCNGACDGTASVDLGLNGSRTYHAGINDTITLLNGVHGTAGMGDSGGQSPGHYTVEGANEGNATQVYITFSDTGGNVVDSAATIFIRAAL